MAGRVVLVFVQVATFAAFAATARPLANGDSEFDWPMIGRDPANTRDQPFEHRIRPGNEQFPRQSLGRARMTVG